MRRLTAALLALGLVPILAGCGTTCESLQDEINEIGREVRANPESVLDRSDELESLGNQMQEMGC